MGAPRPTMHNGERPAGAVHRLNLDPAHRDRGPQTYIVTADRTVYVEFTRSNYQPGTPQFGKVSLSWRTMRDGPGKRKVLAHHDRVEQNAISAKFKGADHGI